MQRLPTLLMMTATFTAILLLSGCGQSGPLYIPGDPSRMTVPPENPENTQQTDEDDDESSS